MLHIRDLPGSEKLIHLLLNLPDNCICLNPTQYPLLKSLYIKEQKVSIQRPCPSLSLRFLLICLLQVALMQGIRRISLLLSRSGYNFLPLLRAMCIFKVGRGQLVIKLPYDLNNIILNHLPAVQLCE